MKKINEILYVKQAGPSFRDMEVFFNKFHADFIQELKIKKETYKLFREAADRIFFDRQMSDLNIDHKSTNTSETEPI